MENDKLKVLVPIDFKKHTKYALNYAAFYAQTLKAEIHLLYTVEQEGFLSELLNDINYDELIQKSSKKLDFLADELRAKRIDVHVIVKVGKIYETILDYADIIQADFIFMATGGADNFNRRFIGSNTLRVIRSSNIPVISIRDDNPTLQVKNIILPLIISKETREKVNTAIKLAQAFNATIKIISISESDNEVIELKWLDAVTTQVEAHIENAGVKYTLEHLNIPESEKISEAVIQYANENAGDLIVIMTQQEVSLAAMFVGYFAQSVINNANVPVCTIHPTEKTIVMDSFRAQG